VNANIVGVVLTDVRAERDQYTYYSPSENDLDRV
jgi:hypothetical protein